MSWFRLIVVLTVVMSGALFYVVQKSASSSASAGATEASADHPASPRSRADKLGSLPKTTRLPKIPVADMRRAVDDEVGRAREVTKPDPASVTLIDAYEAKAKAAVELAAQLDDELVDVRAALDEGDYTEAVELATKNDLVERSQDTIQAIEEAKKLRARLTAQMIFPEGSNAEEEEKPWYEVVLDVLVFVLKIVLFITQLFGSDTGTGPSDGGGSMNMTETNATIALSSIGDGSLELVGGVDGPHWALTNRSNPVQPKLSLGLNGDAVTTREYIVDLGSHHLGDAFAGGSVRVDSVVEYGPKHALVRCVAHGETYDVMFSSERPATVVNGR